MNLQMKLMWQGAISEIYALYLFLMGINDPYFEMKVETQNNKDDNTLV